MKHLTAKQLLDFLVEQQNKGVDLSKVKVNHRPNRDSDVKPISVVEEDLFDDKTNSTLESIVLIGNAKEV